MVAGHAPTACDAASLPGVVVPAITSAALWPAGSSPTPCGPAAAASRPAGSRRTACGPAAEGPGSNRENAAEPLGAQRGPISCSTTVPAGGPQHHPSRPELSHQEIPPTIQQTSAALKPNAAPACPTALTAETTWAAGVRHSAVGGPEHRRASAVLSRTALPALHPLAQRRGAPLPCWQNAALMRCMPGLPAHNGRRPASQHGRPMRLPARSTGSVLLLPQWLEATVASAAAASSSAVLLRALPTSHAKRQRLNASAQTAATFKALFKVAVLGGSRCPR